MKSIYRIIQGNIPPIWNAFPERRSIITGEQEKNVNIEFIDDPLAIFCRFFLPSSASLSSASVFSSGSSSIVLLFGMIGSVFTWSNRRFDVFDDDFDLLIYDNSLFALKKNVKLIIIINLIFLYLQSYSFAGAEPRQST